MNSDKRVLVLSAFIGVNRRPKFLFFSPVIELRPEFVDRRLGEKRLIRVLRSLAPYPSWIRSLETRLGLPVMPCSSWRPETPVTGPKDRREQRGTVPGGSVSGDRNPRTPARVPTLQAGVPAPRPSPVASTRYRGGSAKSRPGRQECQRHENGLDSAFASSPFPAMKGALTERRQGCLRPAITA
jgi:hypothetical protein